MPVMAKTREMCTLASVIRLDVAVLRSKHNTSHTPLARIKKFYRTFLI